MNSPATSAVYQLLEGDDDELSTASLSAWLNRDPETLAKDAIRSKILSGRARESQYVSNYLAVNDARGQGNGLTVGSYLAGRLRGLAKTYAHTYARSLENALNARVLAGLATRGKSRHGGCAYYSVPE